MYRQIWHLCRLQSVTEFDCFVKSFHYLAARMPRKLLLEPFELEAIEEPIEYVTSQLNTISGAQGKNISQGVDFDLAAAMLQQIRSATGRPPADEVQPPVETPLSESEADMYPCILAMCGSGFGFMKVSLQFVVRGEWRCLNTVNSSIEHRFTAYLIPIGSDVDINIYNNVYDIGPSMHG